MTINFQSNLELKKGYFMRIPHENAKFELSYDDISIAFVNVLKKWKYNSSYNEKTKREYFKFLCNILGIRNLEKAKEGHRYFKFSKVYELLHGK